MENILVVGSNSFIGNNLVKVLIDRNFKVFGTSRGESKIDSSLYQHILWDATNPTLPHLINKIDAIILLSTVANINNNLNIMTSNLNIVNNVMKLAQTHSVEKLIFTSSLAVYKGYTDLLEINEKTIPWSNEEYGLSKIASEKLLKELDLKVFSIIRLPGIIGPKAIHSFIPNLVKKLRLNEEVVITNPNSLFNHVLAVSDLSSLILKILSLSNVNIEAPVGVFPDITLMEIVKILKTATNSKSKILIGEPIMPSSIILSQVWTQLGLKQPKCSKTIQDFAMNY